MNNIKKVLLLTVAWVVGSLSAHSQNLGDWQVYPSYSTVNGIGLSGETIYGATLGGIFQVSANEVAQTYTTLDGLYRSDPTAVIYDDEYERVIAGYIDGTIDVLNPETGEVERLEDIQRVTRFNTKRVNAFDIYQGKLYVSSGFGVVVYNLDNLLVENSYLSLGNFTTGAPVQNLDIADGQIFVATSEGVAVGDLNENLVERSNWANYSENDGLPGIMIQDVLSFNDELYSLAADTVYIFENQGWVPSSAFTGLNAVAMSRDENSRYLAVAGENTVRVLDEEANTNLNHTNISSSISTLMISESGLYVGTRNEGIIEIHKTTVGRQQFLPTGPYLNFFSEMVTVEDRILAVSTNAFPQSDPFNPIRGYYIYEDMMWENYNINTSQELNEEGFSGAYSVAYTEDYYYVGSWGNGIARHSRSDDNIQVYNTANSNLTGWRDGPNYLVVGGLAADSEGNMWMVSSDSEFPFNVQPAGSDEWISFRGEPIGARTYFDIFIDSFDQKWIPLIDNLSSGVGTGLMVMKTGNPEDADDDTFVRLSESETNGNLPNSTINAIIQDANDEVWIGTDRGIARFIFPELLVDGGPNERRAQWLINEDTTATSRFLLRDVNVSAMAVDGANQKWIGSENQGIWVLNEEGSAIVDRFTSENSPLISNSINDISIIGETGEVLISTDLGLVSYNAIAQAPEEKMSELKVFPNPFNYDRHNQVVVEGLSEITTIKILGIDGVVVNEVQGRGGRISWDGRDYNGNRLGSGVYFVVAYEDDGSEKGIGKVVIIR